MSFREVSEVGSARYAGPITERERLLQNRWLILVAGILCMIAVANYQYAWTLFVTPLEKRFGLDNTAPIQVAFTVFVLLETWLVPFEGWLVDRFGPRNLVLAGGALAGLGWVASGYSSSLTQLYLSYALCGIGAGIVYGTAIGTALKWFPDHRGLCAGLTAAGYGIGAALTVAPIASLIKSGGYESAFIQWGILQGIVVVVFSLFMKAPPQGWLPRTWTIEARAAEVKKRQTALDFTPLQAAATPQFWLLYFMMALVATGGLMATAQLGPMATDFKVANITVSFLWITLPALTFALALDRYMNGFTRPFFGWVSDHIGRERTMTIAFTLEAIAIFLLIQNASHPIAFVVMTGLTFFAWGEIYSLFPSTVGDFFGRKYATSNYGFMYTAKGTSSVFVPIGSALAAGKVFDFGADALLIIGGLIVVYTVFIAPTVLRIRLSQAAKTTLWIVGGVIVLGGIVLTLAPSVHTPLRTAVPNIGWLGVFTIAIICDLIGAALAFFVLRRIPVPAGGERPSVVPAGATAAAVGGK